jgi:hypothetical protein
MNCSKIIDHRFFIRLDLDHSLKANSLFQTNAQNRENLANQLLIYDEIIIPTKDFGIIPILINWFGLETFRRALEENAFSFLHTNSLLAYGGNGIGLSGYIIEVIEDGGKPFLWWQDTMFRESSIAVEQQIKNMCPLISKIERENIILQILERTKEVEYENNFFMKNIVHETYYNDIEGSKELSLFVNNDILKGENGTVYLERLPIINSNEMKVLNQQGKVENSIDLILRIAEINIELYMASLCDGADLFTSDGAEILLNNKLLRAGIDKNSLDSFLSLSEFRNIPNIGRIVASGDFSLNSLWKIRQTKKSREFRKWFNSLDARNPDDIKKLYVDALERKSWVESLPLKLLRFIITSVVGTIEPVSGFAISTADNFFLNQWTKGYSPKLFLDEISKIKIKSNK